MQEQALQLEVPFYTRIELMLPRSSRVTVWILTLSYCLYRVLHFLAVST